MHCRRIKHNVRDFNFIFHFVYFLRVALARSFGRVASIGTHLEIVFFFSFSIWVDLDAPLAAKRTQHTRIVDAIGRDVRV